MDIVNLQSLIEEGRILLHNTHQDRLGIEYVDFDSFKIWERRALLFLQTEYQGHPQTNDFDGLVQKSGHRAADCALMLAILEAFNSVNPVTRTDIDYHSILDNLFQRFHSVANQLKRRHERRDTLLIQDEYDVQDLLEALFKLFFDDVRPEEWCPSYAGSSKRMDFLLKNEEIVVEVKMTRLGHEDKKIGEELIIDIANYKNHPNCKELYCFAYDPDGMIRNPRGLEHDLTKETDGLKVITYVCPR